MADQLIVAKSPCGTCPYRKDVPAGVWHPSEYRKLMSYDGPTMAQSPAYFLCHQQSKPGELCAGWLACHNPDELLALRFVADRVHQDVWDYKSPVPVFASGEDAAIHGMSGVLQPDERAGKAIDGLVRKRRRRRRRVTREQG